MALVRKKVQPPSSKIQGIIKPQTPSSRRLPSAECPVLARVFERLRQRIPLRQEEQAGDYQCRRQEHEHAIPAPALMEEAGNRAAEDSTKRPTTVDQSRGSGCTFTSAE